MASRQVPITLLKLTSLNVYDTRLRSSVVDIISGNDAAFTSLLSNVISAAVSI